MAATDATLSAVIENALRAVTIRRARHGHANPDRLGRLSEANVLGTTNRAKDVVYRWSNRWAGSW